MPDIKTPTSNKNCPGWPLYITPENVYFRAIEISRLEVLSDGSIKAHLPEGHSPVTLSAAFGQVAKPEIGGVLYLSGYGELLYMNAEQFAGTCKSLASTQSKQAKAVSKLYFDQPEDYSGIAAALMSIQGRYNELIDSLTDAGVMEREGD